MVNLLVSHFLSIKYHHRHNRTIQFQYKIGSDSREDNKYFIEVEAIPIDVSDSSSDEDV